MVADEIDAAFGPGKGQVIGGVAGGGDRLQCKARAFDDVAVLDLDVGPEIAVGAGFRIVLLALENGVNLGKSFVDDPEQRRPARIQTE